MLKEGAPIAESETHSWGASRIWGGELFMQAHALMHGERLSAGGNIREKSKADLQTLVGGGGQLWGWIEQGKVLSVCTLELKSGTRSWWYINNGVTHPEHRNRGLSGLLVARAMEANGQSANYIVMYVRQHLFEQLGFTEVSVDTLMTIDEPIAHVIRGKLRPEKEVHIFVKTAGGR